MTFYSLRWAEWVRKHRRERRMKSRELAKLVEVDPSYITLIERDGFVPKMDIVRLIAQVFDKEAEGLTIAGYSPVPDGERRQFVESASNTRDGIPFADIMSTAKTYGFERTLNAVKAAILLAKATRADSVASEVA